MYSLYPAQALACNRLFRIINTPGFRGAVLRGDEGTGKTIIAYRVAYLMRPHGRTLYVTPAGARKDIENKLKQYGGDELIDVISYHKFKSVHKMPAAEIAKYALIIFDECHNLRKYSNGATRRMISLGGKKKFLFMSGTPMVKCESDFLYVLRKCGVWKGKSMRAIKVRYFNALPSYFGNFLELGEFQNEEEFYDHASQVTVELSHKDVDPDIPDFKIKDIIVPGTPKPFTCIEEETATRLENGLKKVPHCAEHIIIAAYVFDGPILALTHFHEVAEELGKKINRKPVLTKEGVFKAFEELRTGKRKILITTLGLTQSSLDLNECNHVFLVESTYSFATDRQSIRRCQRIGKRDIVNVYYMRMEDERPVDISMSRKHLTEMRGIIHE